jgi:hypothetical protein
MQKHGWMETTESETDMVSFAKSMQKLDPTTAKFIHRLTVHKLSTASYLYNPGQQEHAKCKACDDKETFDHVFQCPSKSIW